MKKNEILASKLYSTHPDDSHLYVVVRCIPSSLPGHKDEYVTHIYNAYDKGYHFGHYFTNLKDAMADFAKRGA